MNCLMTAWHENEAELRGWPGALGTTGNSPDGERHVARNAFPVPAGGCRRRRYMLLIADAHALEVKFQPVAEGVYAYIGDTGPRSVENEGLNANLGLVVTPAGAVLIDSGATYRVRAPDPRGGQKVTPQPVKWVINTGGQDHRWLGNGYFKAQGAEIIAHADARGRHAGARRRPPGRR